MEIVKFVSGEIINKVIEEREPKGLFITKSGGWWVAVDNSTGHAWTEEFSDLEGAYTFVTN